MKVNDVVLVTLERGGSLLVMPMVLDDGQRLLHCDVEAYDDEDRIATIGMTDTEAERFADLLLQGVKALRAADRRGAAS